MKANELITEGCTERYMGVQMDAGKDVEQAVEGYTEGCTEEQGCIEGCAEYYRCVHRRVCRGVQMEEYRGVWGWVWIYSTRPACETL